MIKTHEINLNTSSYNLIKNANCAIIEDDTRPIEENDYVLFKQVEIIEGEIIETGLYTFVKINKVISSHIGLQQGYIMISYNEIN